jgi:hypothetical protein
MLCPVVTIEIVALGMKMVGLVVSTYLIEQRVSILK